MTAAIAHRGPDGRGSWESPDGRVLFAHTRLAVVDLSERGRQPMHYDGGRLTIAFNGEIYNFREIAAELRELGFSFVSGTDTEVIMAAVHAWGMEGALRRLVGMFAFALWDAQERTLYLARDRLGEKPLYICARDGVLAFASELTAIAEVAGCAGVLSASAVAGYLELGYVPEPLSMWEGVYKLPPGRFLKVRTPTSLSFQLGGTGELECRGSDAGAAAIVTYWSLASVRRDAEAAPLQNDAQAIEGLDELLRRAVSKQLENDVETGVFLSGGLDSTLVAATAQAESSVPVRTFTVAFDDPRYDESAFAARIARHIGTDHSQLRLGAESIVELVPQLAHKLDEPTANGSYFASYAISKLAREHVTVVLSGDGGDELFAGYNRYHQAQRAWQSVRYVPWPVRAAASGAVGAVIESAGFGSAVARLLPMPSGQTSLAARFQKARRIASARSAADAYHTTTQSWSDPASLLRPEFSQQALHAGAWDDHSGFILAAKLLDQMRYLPGDNLAKLDRASMAVALETRLPLLDHRIVEWSWRLPERMNVRDGASKWVMRRLLERYVPASLTERPKMGFTVPVDDWLRGPLASWATDRVLGGALWLRGPFDQRAVLKAHARFRRGAGVTGSQMWSLAMMSAWLEGHANPASG